MSGLLLSNAFLSFRVGRWWLLPKIFSIEVNLLSHVVLAVWEGTLLAKNFLNCLSHLPGFVSHRTLLVWAGKNRCTCCESHLAIEIGLTRRLQKALRQGEALISAILNGPGPDLNLEGRKTRRFCLNEPLLRQDFNFPAGNKNSKNNFIIVYRTKSATIGLYAKYIGFLSAEGDFFGKKPEKTLLPPTCAIIFSSIQFYSLRKTTLRNKLHGNVRLNTGPA
jgi:hypothetical protein